jgi:hypothetical protein
MLWEIAHAQRTTPVVAFIEDGENDDVTISVVGDTQRRIVRAFPTSGAAVEFAARIHREYMRAGWRDLS